MISIPKRILVSTYMLIASTWKLIAFEYENKESRESNNHTKRLNWSSFKEAPYRNLYTSQQPYVDNSVRINSFSPVEEGNRREANVS